jgi:hypothetical protein
MELRNFIVAPNICNDNSLQLVPCFSYYVIPCASEIVSRDCAFPAANNSHEFVAGDRS